MKYILLLSLFLLYTPSAKANDVAKGDCFKTAMTQMEMTDCSALRAQKISNELIEEVGHIRKLISNRPKKLAAFEKAQKNWEQYRQSQVDFLYFDHGGSINPMCQHDQYAILTNARLKQLKQWVEDSEIGSNQLCDGNIFYDSDPE